MRPSRRKVICSIASGAFAPLSEISRPGLEAYAERHGWDLVVANDCVSHGRPPSWAKVPLVADLLRSHELVLWLDADAVITDGAQDLACELRFGRQLYLVEHHHPPTGEVTANAGVFMLRAGRWAERFLADVWAQADLIQHRWWDNAAVMRLLGYRIDPQPARRERKTRWRIGVRFWTSPGILCRTGTQARRRESSTSPACPSRSAESRCWRRSGANRTGSGRLRDFRKRIQPALLDSIPGMSN
jgi:galactosyl transferase GMA12/MNN10 family